MWKTEPTKAVSVLNHPKLQQAKDIDILCNLSLGRLDKFYSYGAIRGKTLFIYFTHSIGASEFNLRKEQILAKMREVYKKRGLKRSLIFTDVQAKVVPGRKESKVEKKDSFVELAKGDFDTSHIKDPVIAKHFRNIKQIIKDRREAQND